MADTSKTEITIDPNANANSPETANSIAHSAKLATSPAHSLAENAQAYNPRLERSYKLNLPIGSRMVLRFGWSSQKNELEAQAELVGYAHYEFLLAKIQPAPGLLPRIKNGELVHVRFTHDGTTMFQTEILGHLTRPSLVLALDYPQTMNTVQVRKHRRVSCTLPVIAYAQGQKISGIINDISRGGCSLVLDVRGQSVAKALHAGDEIEMHVPLDLSQGLELIKATVKNIDSEQYRMFIGLSFAPLSANTEQRLESFLANTEVLLSAERFSF